MANRLIIIRPGCVVDPADGRGPLRAGDRLWVELADRSEAIGEVRAHDIDHTKIVEGYDIEKLDIMGEHVNYHSGPA